MKADPKAKGKAAAEPEAPPAANPKKKLVMFIGIAVVAAATAGGGVWFMTKKAGGESTHKEVKAEPPVFVAIDPFTVNLQPENGDQYLQTTLTLQVAGQAQVDLIKLNMPQVRSRLLLLLSSKKASEINSADGKRKLTEEIIEAVKTPFVEKGKPQEITGVFFTSFIIQ